jgi:elongation factor 1 alpha-like protein
VSFTAIINAHLVIEIEEESVPWAAAGSSTTVYLSGVDPVNLRYDLNFMCESKTYCITSVGCVLCHPEAPVELVTTFLAQLIIFDVQVPLIPGSSVCVRTPSQCYSKPNM